MPWDRLSQEVFFLKLILHILWLDLAATKIRGRIVSFYQSSVCIGIILAYALNIPFSFVKDGWRYEFALAACPPLALLIMCFFFPEGNGYTEKKLKKKERLLLKKTNVSNNNTSQANVSIVVVSPQESISVLTAYSSSSVPSSRNTIGNDSKNLIPEYKAVGDDNLDSEGDNGNNVTGDEKVAEGNSMNIFKLFVKVLFSYDF
jgi:hypothetical protein